MRKIMPFPFPPCPAEASALLLAIWCVAVLSITVLAVARLVESDVEDAALKNRRFEARELALTGVAYGMHPKIEPWDSLLSQNFGGDRKLRVKVISEAARIDINRALKEKDQAMLRKLFEIWGAKETVISAAVSSLMDWIDPDDIRLLNGAEKDELRNQTRYSLPANRDFHSVSEMERVRGMDEIAALKPDWADSFTVNGNRRIDLQDAPIDVMRAGGLTTQQAAQIDQVRRGADREAQTKDDFKIKNVAEFLRKVGLSQVQIQALQARFGAGVGPMRISSRAKVSGTEYEIVVVSTRGAEDNALIVWDEQ
jgi:type II secretory pathway component PulK